MGRKSKKIIAILLSMLMVFSVCSPITGGAGLGSTSAKAGAEARTATASDADVRLYGAMRASGDKYDLSTYLDSVTVGKKESGTYVETDKVFDGDDIQISIKYTMPDGIISEENNQVTYQLPGNIKLSSEIKDGVVKSGELTVGTYTIDENGLVTITYRTDMSNFNPSKKFPGTLIFNCSANANKKQEEDSISFDGSGTTIKVVPAKDAFDIDVTKTGGSYDPTTNKIHYTVKVSSVKGTRDTVTVTDTVNDASGMFTIDASSIIVNGTSYSTGVTVGKTSDNKSTMTIKDLPKLDAGESYTIEYDVDVDPDQVKNLNGSKWINNQAKVESKDEDASNDKDAYVNTEVKHEMLTKGASVSGSTITWTITVNGAGENLNGFTLKDVLTPPAGMTIDTSDIKNFTVTPAKDGLTADKLFGSGYTFTDDDTNKYTITYTYTSENDIRDTEEKYKNDAELSDQDTDYTASKDATIGKSDYQYKNFKSASNETKQGGVYTWEIGVRIPESGIPAGSYTKDTLGDKLIINKDTWGITGLPTGAELVFHGTDGIDYTDINDLPDGVNADGFTINYTQDIQRTGSLREFRIQYTTYADYTGMSEGDKRVFQNTTALTINGKTEQDSANHEYEIKTPMIKYVNSESGDWSWKADGENSVLDCTNASYGKLRYRIAINRDGGLTNTTSDVVITDELPDGATWAESEGVYAYRYDSSKNEYKSNLTTTQSGNKLIFTLDKSVFSTSEIIYIEYTLNMPKKKGSYTNKASIDGTNISSQITQKVTGDNTSDNTISKNGADTTRK